MRSRLRWVSAALPGMCCMLSAAALRSAEVANAVAFEWFEYTGRDAIFEAPLPAGSYRNPILAGFYPDPSICRVGDDFYLVTSSFAYFPGIPIFHSRDLVHWTQLGHVLDRAAQANFDGRGVSRGVFAPAIGFHDGLFYVINTLVDAGGNFFVTAKNPAGPWSDPVWLNFDGIDPSLFFDDDGRAYIVNNGPPVGAPLYEGHRAIWIQELDLKAQKLSGPREVVVNGGVDLARRPIWIEAPHVFKRGDWYYLICAEGGTAEEHSEVVFRSRAVRGPYAPWERNPILTQRDLDPQRTAPITCTGHADFVAAPDGTWWAVFLGCRPYEGNRYHTGRETFMLPVTWTDDDWPVILPAGEVVPTVVAGPKLPAASAASASLNGNFTWRDEFDAPTLASLWMFLRTPHETWWSLTDRPGALTLTPRAATLAGRENPSFIARRQQHADFSASTALHVPAAAGISAGLVAFQNETHHFFFGVRRNPERGVEVFLERASGSETETAPRTVAVSAIDAAGDAPVGLKIEGHGGACSFFYATRPGEWKSLRENEDASILSTAVAGGFVGATLGLHARIEP